MNLQPIRSAIDAASQEYSYLQSIRTSDISEQQVLGHIERLRQQLEQVEFLISDLLSTYPTEAKTIFVHKISVETLRSDVEAFRCKFLADTKARQMATKYAQRQTALEDKERIHTNLNIISHLENIHRILSQEAARSEACLHALQESTDVLRCVSHGHDNIAMASAEGRRCVAEIDNIGRKDRRIVRTLFITFCATAVLVIRHRLKRINIYPFFLP